MDEFDDVMINTRMCAMMSTLSNHVGLWPQAANDDEEDDDEDDVNDEDDDVHANAGLSPQADE